MNRGRISISVFLCFLVMMFLVVSGCSKSDDPAYNISGAVTGATGVTINLTGAATATTTTDASGNYSFTGRANGTYTVTPVKTGYIFNPVSLVASVSGASVTGHDFVATATGASTFYSISGTVSGAASSGVTITLSGANTGSVVTGAGGTYSIPGLVPGSYTVTPSLTGFTFSPTSSAEITITAANSTANNFVATAIPIAHSISGTVTVLGLPLSGVTITVTGNATATATTNASGVFNVTGLYDGNYTLTPSKTGYTFSPTSSAATVSGADIAGKDFTATVYVNPTHSISGMVSGAVQAGVTITLSGDGSATTTTNTSGNYSLSGVANGNYTVTPSKTGYTFSPINAAANVSGADVTVPNFVATAIPVTYPLQSAYKTLNANGFTRSFTISGSCRGSGSITSTPAATAATFEGVAALSAITTETISLSNCLPATITGTTTHYFDSSYFDLGSEQVGGNYGVFLTPLTIPTSATVGGTGTIGTQTFYTNSTKATGAGRSDMSYVIEADTSITAIANVIFKTYNAAGTLTSTEQDRYRIDAIGALTPISGDIQGAGIHLIFTFN